MLPKLLAEQANQNNRGLFESDSTISPISTNLLKHFTVQNPSWNIEMN